MPAHPREDTVIAGFLGPINFILPMTIYPAEVFVKRMGRDIPWAILFQDKTITIYKC